MAKSSIKYIDASGSGKKKSLRIVPNAVVYGRFPKRISQLQSSPVDKINKFLSFILLCLVILSLVSYYFVSDTEKTMNALGREIVSLNNENIELQNKLDHLNSFNKVDAAIRENTTLDTAKNVIEIPAISPVSVSVKKLTEIPVNYKWSIGY